MDYSVGHAVPMVRVNAPAGTVDANFEMIFWANNNDQDPAVAAAFYLDDIVIDTIPAEAQQVTVGGAKKLPEGTAVILSNEVVTLAPRKAGARNTSYFYVSETDRSSAIKVVDVDQTQDALNAGDTVTITGVVLSDTETGEKYIQITGTNPTGTPGTSVAPFGTTTRSASEDAKTVGQLVTVAGKVVDPGDGTYFTVKDGYMDASGVEVETKVIIAGDAPAITLTADKFVTVTGVVSRVFIENDPATADDDQVKPIVILKGVL
jgi:hypothetical protein